MPDSKIIRKRITVSVRSTATLVIVAALATIIGDAEALRTLLIACQAAFATTGIATVAQWAYTSANFTDSKISRQNQEPNTDYIDELIIAARLRVLGMIYIGVAVVVGLVYFATYRGTF